MADSKRKKFTDQGLERLQYDPAQAPSSGRMEIKDALCPGLILRVTPRGVKTFSVIYKVPGEGGVSPAGRLLAGKQHRITLGATPPLDLKSARERAREILLAASQGRDIRRERIAAHQQRHQNTFQRAFTRFIEQEIKPNVSSWRNVERALSLHVLPHWAERGMHEIRRSDIHEILDALVARNLPGAGSEVRKHLSRFFNWAVDRELMAENPVVGLKRNDLRNPEDAGRALTDLELKVVWNSACSLGYPFGALFRLLMLTGQRRNDWAHARHSELDLRKGWLEIPKSRYKSRRDHIVPLSPQALKLVAELPTNISPSGFVFSSREGQVPVSGFSRAKTALDNKAGALMKLEDSTQFIKNYRIHDFRVTCETRLATLGFNQDVRDAVLGHAKQGLQRTYNKYDYHDEKRLALAAYASHLAEITK
ncbi:tyrosine-type recombinase/integrase [Bradyrhizobium paxllaeri]|uniref:tyrosine-type recombinase/integrase n=1 Tax=Bradyrhizobium paxllaeri TaxID=190148 RepID=UPI000810778C|nr:site-specific integrase [Bradyrhizobium paxllaeri]